MNECYHIPVMLQECINGLNINPDGIYVDVTFGGGGHSKEILKHLDKGHLYVFDQDEDAKANLPEDSRVTFVQHNFKFIRHFMAYYGVESVDGILADLGVSSHEFDVAERGFSFRFDGDLDMRMNQQARVTAADIVNNYDEDKLADILFKYGDVKSSRKIARFIVKARSNRKIVTISDFKEAIAECTPKTTESKYLARIFQALRIEVNDEMKALEIMLESTADLLASGGRLVVMTYHSLEDKAVKKFMKSGRVDGKVEKDFYGKINTPFLNITRRVIIPTDEEIDINPRSRSAKLRIVEKI